MRTLTPDGLVFFVTMAVIMEVIFTWVVLQGGQLIPFSSSSLVAILATVALGAAIWRYRLPQDASDEG